MALVAAGAAAVGTTVLPQLVAAVSDTLTATTNLNVREAPDSKARVLGVLAVGEQVKRRGEPEGDWTPITWKGRDAWVLSAYVVFEGTEAAAEGTATVTEDAHLRAAATTLAPSLGVMAAGETVSITGKLKGTWAPVNWQGHDGWAYAAYLDFNATAADTAAETTADQEAEPAQTDPVDEVGSDVVGTMYTTDAVNVREGPSTDYRSLTVLASGTTVDIRGGSSNGWTPVRWNDQNAWISSDYLTDSPDAVPTTTRYTTTDVNLRTGPSLNYRVIRVLAMNTEVQVTGVTQGDWTQVVADSTMCWISSLYLSDYQVSASSGSNYGPEQPNVAHSEGTLNTGGSSGLDELRETTKQVVYAIRNTFPEIVTMYGVRPDPIPDHPSGRAVDLMMPNGQSDVDLGNRVAAYLQANANALNIEYLIWRQRIWINGDSDWTWMADRGGVTANHYDHVHVTVNY